MAPTFSFCITCKQRRGFVEQTLEPNLRALPHLGEIVLLDYDSGDGLRQWVLETFPDALAAGRLRLYSLAEPAAIFHAGHAKNIAHLLGRGSVLVNLDADNLLHPSYLQRLAAVVWAEVDMLFPDNDEGGGKGRIAVTASRFRVMRGYTEAFGGYYGYDDIDLYRRWRAARLPVCTFKHVDPPCLKHEDALRLRYTPEPLTRDASSARNRQLCEQALHFGRYAANLGRGWGQARLLDHAGQPCTVGRA